MRLVLLWMHGCPDAPFTPSRRPDTKPWSERI